MRTTTRAGRLPFAESTGKFLFNVEGLGICRRRGEPRMLESITSSKASIVVQVEKALNKVFRSIGDVFPIIFVKLVVSILYHFQEIASVFASKRRIATK